MISQHMQPSHRGWGRRRSLVLVTLLTCLGASLGAGCPRPTPPGPALASASFRAYLQDSAVQVERVRVTIRRSEELLFHLELAREGSEWTGTSPLLPGGELLTFEAHAWQGERELFSGETTQGLLADRQEVTIRMVPVNNGESVSLPRVHRIMLPEEFISQLGDEVRFLIEAPPGERLHFSLVAPPGGGSFIPSEGSLPLRTGSATLAVRYLPPAAAAEAQLLHSIALRNTAGHAVTTTFATHVLPPTSAGAWVRDTVVHVLFNPVIRGLSAQRLTGTGDVVWTADVEDDGPRSELSYSWSFSALEDYTPPPGFALGQGNPATLNNYTPAVQGRLELAVEDGQGGVTTLSYLLEQDQFPDEVVQRGSIRGLAAGASHTCSWWSSGALGCWGEGASGRLGLGHVSDVGDDELPTLMPDMGKVQQVVAGGSHTCAVVEPGLLRCWGEGGQGQLGYARTSDVGDDEPVSSAGFVSTGGAVLEAAAGGEHTCALLQGRRLRCWGRNQYGQLGYGHTRTLGDDETPGSLTDIGVGGAVQHIAAGEYHTCALLVDGAVRCWGWNGWGQLGTGRLDAVGDDELPLSLTPVALGARALQVAAGGHTTCALLEGGEVRCWGHGVYGQGGQGEAGWTSHRSLPGAAIALSEPARGLAVGELHACALLDQGGATCWGHNGTGQLGRGDVRQRAVPEPQPIPLPGVTAVRLAAGGGHTCALLDSGRVRCWGENNHGQLGYGHTRYLGDDELPSLDSSLPNP